MCVAHINHSLVNLFVRISTENLRGREVKFCLPYMWNMVSVPFSPFIFKFLTFLGIFLTFSPSLGNSWPQPYAYIIPITCGFRERLSLSSKFHKSTFGALSWSISCMSPLGMWAKVGLVFRASKIWQVLSWHWGCHVNKRNKAPVILGFTMLVGAMGKKLTNQSANFQ